MNMYRKYRYKEYLRNTLYWEIFYTLKQEFPKVKDKKLNDVAEHLLNAEAKYFVRMGEERKKA